MPVDRFSIKVRNCKRYACLEFVAKVHHNYLRLVARSIDHVYVMRPCQHVLEAHAVGIETQFLVPKCIDKSLLVSAHIRASPHAAP